MKTLNLILALAAPALLAAGYVPDNYNTQYRGGIQAVAQVNGDYDSFRLCKKPYYKELFSKKELKKLQKAEKLRTQALDYLLLASNAQKQANDLRTSSPELTDKIQKQIAKLEDKAAQLELDGLKTHEKATDIFRVVYTNVLNNKTFSASTLSEKTAQNLSIESQNDYQAADAKKENLTSGNAMETYRAMYTLSSAAIHDQEIALAIYKGDKDIDYTKYISNSQPSQTADGNIPKDSIPVLIASEHYVYDLDSNLYRLRFREFEEKLKLSDDDKKILQKIEEDEATAAQLFQKAQTLGCTADTFRVYSGEAVTLAEREYYEQKAQEDELNECNSLVKAIKLEIASNNSLFALYQKYVPKIRNAKDSLAKSFEDQADDLYKLSKTYEELAAKQYSLVEQYTQLSEGNEVKLQAIQNMENAIASYLGCQVGDEKMSLASGASEKHNDIAIDMSQDESDGASAKPANVKPANGQSSDAKPANSKPANGQSAANTVKPASNTKPSGSGAKPASGNSSKPQTAQQSSRQPAIASSSAAVVSTSFYTRSDQRMKPYTYPKGTMFSVEAGIYKEMPEPVEFPAIDKFIAQNLKNTVPMRYYIGEFQTYDAALAATDMAKQAGYSKAKVVAFTNGKSVDVASAKKTAEKASGYQALVQEELKKLNASRQATTPMAANGANNASGAAVPLTQLSGELFAVQISSVPTLLDAKAFNVSDLYYDRNEAGLYRYYTGVSNDINIANANLATMRQSGYEDAYIIHVVDGKNTGSASSRAQAQVSNYPVYRVQIGAYKSAVSANTKSQIDKLKAQGYTVHQSKSGEYTIYCVGDCGSRQQAEKLRDELKTKGYPEAYIVTFVNGIKQ